MVNFIQLNICKKEMLLGQRNNQETQKWTHTQDEILLHNHLNFINSFKIRDDKFYFVLKNEDKYLSVVDFSNFANDSCKFEFYLNQFLVIAEISRVLEKILIDYVFKILKIPVLGLEVFNDNSQVINLNKKYNFSEIKRKVASKKEVQCVELKNENR